MQGHIGLSVLRHTASLVPALAMDGVLAWCDELLEASPAAASGHFDEEVPSVALDMDSSCSASASGRKTAAAATAAAAVEIVSVPDVTELYKKDITQPLAIVRAARGRLLRRARHAS